MAIELIKELDPSYKGTYRTRIDWLANAVNLPIKKIVSLLIQDGAEFDNPAHIAPESWFSLDLKNGVKKSAAADKETSGFTYQSGGKGKKVPRNIPPDVFDEWNG